VDSDLGESYESLANVQSPSWNHAILCGIRTNEYRVLAAVALSRTKPSTLPKVTDYSIRFKPVARLSSVYASPSTSRYPAQDSTGRLPEFPFVSRTFLIIAPDRVEFRISANPVFVQGHLQPSRSKRDVRPPTADRQLESKQ
jgi:hypothetical protein